MVINMGDWVSVWDGRCEVCFAGAVMVAHGNIRINEKVGVSGGKPEWRKMTVAEAVIARSDAKDDGFSCVDPAETESGGWNAYHFFALNNVRLGVLGAAYSSFLKAKSGHEKAEREPTDGEIYDVIDKAFSREELDRVRGWHDELNGAALNHFIREMRWLGQKLLVNGI